MPGRFLREPAFFMSSFPKGFTKLWRESGPTLWGRAFRVSQSKLEVLFNGTRGAQSGWSVR